MFGYHPSLSHHSAGLSGSTADLTSKILQLTFLVASLVIAMFLNGLVAYCLGRKRRFAASAGNQFLFSLTLSNFINAIFSLPMLIAAGASDAWSWGAFTCQTSAFVHLLVGVNGNLTLAMIAYDRYHAIVKPLRYHQQISGWRSVCILVGGWIFSLLVTAAPLWGWSAFAYHPSLFVCSISWKQHPVYALVLFIGVVLIPMLIMLVCYTYVYLAARFQQYSIANQFSASTKDFNESIGSQPAAPEDPLLKGSPTRLKHKLPWIVVTYSRPDKAKRTLLLLLFSYSVCWGAMLIWASADIAGTSTNTLAFVCYFVNSLSAIVNPLIYGFMNKPIRKHISKMVCRRRIGRRGTGGRKRRKRTKAISLQLQPPSRSASPNSSPMHSTHNSMASFFDYLPKQLGAGVRGTEQENTRPGFMGDSQANGGIDSYDIIRLWTRKFNPFGSAHSPAQQRQSRGDTMERHWSMNEWKTGANRVASEPYFEKSMRDADSDLSDVDAGLLSPQRNTKPFRESGNKRDGTDNLFEYRGQHDRNRPILVDEDYDSHLLSPKIPGSRLSSVSEFTDVPPYESSNCATSDDDDPCDDV